MVCLSVSPVMRVAQLPGPGTGSRGHSSNRRIVIRRRYQHHHPRDWRAWVMPHTGTDAIAAGANFITTVQQASTRLVDSREAGVISFGLFQGGTVRNVLPASIRIEGTMRTTSEAVRDRLAQLLEDAARSTELLFGVSIEIEVAKVAPVTMNHPTAVAAVAASAMCTIGA
ncbi:MAG: peptidase dimerization domain-containing protein, partial [Pikeienuella sp.]